MRTAATYQREQNVKSYSSKRNWDISAWKEGWDSFHRKKKWRQAWKKEERGYLCGTHCDTVQAHVDQTEKDRGNEGGQSLQKPSLWGLKRWRERDGGEGKQKTEISG